VSAAIAYVSFLIRLWQDEGEHIGEKPQVWRGHIEHIQSGKHWYFETLDDLLDFLRLQAQDPTILAPEDEGGDSRNKDDR